MINGYKDIRELIEKSPFVGLLERFGIKSVLGEAVRWILSAEERQRHHAIESDYQACKATIQALSKELPAGDPSKPVWMIGSMHTVLGVKLEGILSLAVRLAGMMPIAVHPTRFRWVEKYHRIFSMERALYFEKYHGMVRQGSLPDSGISLDC